MLRNGLLRYIHSTHVQSCDVTRVQSATQWTFSVDTSHMSKAVRFHVFGHVTSQRHVTLYMIFYIYHAIRHVTSRPNITLRHQGEAPRHVTSRHNVSHTMHDGAPGCHGTSPRHVRTRCSTVEGYIQDVRPPLSRRHRRRRGQGGRHVASRRRQAPPDKEAVASRHEVRRPQSGPWILWSLSDLSQAPSCGVEAPKEVSVFARVVRGVTIQSLIFSFRNLGGFQGKNHPHCRVRCQWICQM